MENGIFQVWDANNQLEMLMNGGLVKKDHSFILYTRKNREMWLRMKMEVSFFFVLLQDEFISCIFSWGSVNTVPKKKRSTMLRRNNQQPV